MAENSKIEWTDATWNPITGCSVHSPGCTNCYAMRLAGTRMQHHWSRAGLTTMTKSGPVWTGEVRMNWEWLDQPLRWARPRDIFVCAHADLFHPAVPVDWIAQIYGTAIAAVHLRGHRFQVLTKRSDRMRELLNSQEFWELANSFAGAIVMERVDPLDRRSDDARATCEDYGPENPPPGIWVGISCEDQKRADERIPDLLATPAAVRWLSCEPLLGPIDLRSIKAPRYPDEPADSLEIDWRFDALTTGDHYWFDGDDDGPGDSSDGPYRENRIDWVIAGGESGHHARPPHPDWIRALRDQCATAYLDGDEAPVPFLFKQWGEWAPMDAAGIATDGPVTDRHGNVRDWMNRYVLFEGDAGAARVRGHSFTGHATYLVYRVGKKVAGRKLDGVEHNGRPI